MRFGTLPFLMLCEIILLSTAIYILNLFYFVKLHITIHFIYHQPSLASPKVSAAYSAVGACWGLSFSRFFTPETTSSILNKRQEAYIAVFRTWFFTATGSQIFCSYIFAIFFLLPSIPNI